MARQQYYSRVPSRLSLYNRTDGPDTFACSEGLSRDFVEKELSAICNYKPTSGEGTLIRNASLPPIYYQGQAKSGEIFQGRICFLPLDYTGERSSHIAHNIVLSSEESDTLFSTPDSVCLNASMFDGDENKFDFSDPSLTFDDQYPDFPFAVCHSDHAVDPRFLRRKIPDGG